MSPFYPSTPSKRRAALGRDISTQQLSVCSLQFDALSAMTGGVMPKRGTLEARRDAILTRMFAGLALVAVSLGGAGLLASNLGASEPPGILASSRPESAFPAN
jgi:hypothetical protein